MPPVWKELKPVNAFVIKGLMSRFQFDEGKSESNEQKHGIDFHGAQGLWKNVTFEFPIVRSGETEARYLLLGKIDKEPYSAIITYRGGAIRIISARRSNEKEIKLYVSSTEKVQNKQS